MSIAGIGLEKRHLKCPFESRRIPPIAALVLASPRDASTFHFNLLSGGGIQDMEVGAIEVAGLQAFVEFQMRHWGFLVISAAG